MKVKLLKRMTINGKIMEVGTIVDASHWRTAQALKNNRYIEILKDEVKVAPVAEDKPKKAKSEPKKDVDSK